MADDNCRYPTRDKHDLLQNPRNAETERVAIDLPSQIRAATRDVHHTLNATIIRRLSLGLPPETGSPHLYVLGISRIAQIYYAFEDAWLAYLSSVPTGSGDEARYRVILDDVYLPEISRSQRLSSDIKHLTATWGKWDGQHNDEAVRRAIAHISGSIQAKPYVVLAYSWVMYMALFNGGRWIRAQLLGADGDFWHWKRSGVEKSPSRSLIERRYLSFWHFNGSEDGEDIKLAFKTRLIDAGKQLNEAECEEVVAEAKALFQHCLNIVLELDTVVRSHQQQQTPAIRHKHGLSDYHSQLWIGILILGGVLWASLWRLGAHQEMLSVLTLSAD